MTITHILRDLCRECELRKGSSCGIIDSCPTDVLRADDQGYPFISYPDDCHACFLCQIDCPNKAVKVSADITFPMPP